MVDWLVAEKLAGLIAGTPEGRRPVADLAELARDSERRVVAYTGLEPRSPLPPPEGVERPEWVKANLAGMQQLLDPVLEKAGGKGPLAPALRLAAGAIVSAEVGIILGLMAQRVLGQYELVLLEEAERRPPRLLFVMPNLSEAVGNLDVPEDEFVRWVALHEVTHAVQFSGVPWLQDHLAGLVRTLLDHMELRVDAARVARFPALTDLRRAAEHVRRGDLIGLVARPEERATLDRLQVVMSVVEGHAEHVMDAVGVEVLPSLDQLRGALERRRNSATGAAKLLWRLLGLEMKMRQYQQGKAFCDAVVAQGGIERLNIVWSAPEAMPTADELERPAAWLARTAAAA